MTPQNFGSAEIKDHVGPNTPGITEAMETLTAIPRSLFDDACMGDPEAIRDIADRKRLATVYEENMPLALEAVKQVIRVTGEYNKGLAEIAKQVRVSGTQILDATYSAINDESRMMNNIVELRDKQANEVTAEAGRHVRARTLIQIEGTTADLMAVTEYQTRLGTLEDRIPLAQQRADEAYRSAVRKAYWARGSEADIERIRRPDYERNRYGIGAIVRNGFDSFRRVMGL
jgi:hypothetical protein